MKELTEEAKVFMEKLAKFVEPPAVKSEGKVEEEVKEEDNADKGNDNAGEADEKVGEEKEGGEEKDSDK